MAELFDPVEMFRALDRHRVAYVVVGALGRVIEGSDELTDGLDIVPSAKEQNLRRLELALEELHARRADGGLVERLDDELSKPVLELTTGAGDLKIVREPAGTRGYDDLRRGARREPLGQGLRPQVASLGDHARMLSALGREQDIDKLRTLRRLIELEHDLSRGRGLGR